MEGQGRRRSRLHAALSCLCAFVLCVSMAMPSTAAFAGESQTATTTAASDSEGGSSSSSSSSSSEGEDLGSTGASVLSEEGDGDIEIWDGSIDTSWYNTTDTSFTISTAAQLAGLAAITTPAHGTAPADDEEDDDYTGPYSGASNAEGIDYDDFSGKTVTLTADIWLNADGSTANKWYAISDYNTWIAGAGGGSGASISGSFDTVAWKGTFDGGGHVVYNMYIDHSADLSTNFGGYQGLFGGIGEGGVIKNLGVTGSAYGRVVGGIVASSNGVSAEDLSLTTWPRIMNCFADVTITGNGSSSRYSGGIVGGEDDNRTCVSVINCYNLGAVSNAQSAGGVAGVVNGYVAGSYNVGTVGGNNTGSVVATLYLADSSYTGSGVYIGKYVNNLALSGTDTNVYRYHDSSTNYINNPTAVTEGFVSADELKSGASTLGSAYVADTDNINDGYPILFWQAGLDEIDLSSATVTAPESVAYTGSAAEPELTVTLNDATLVEGTDYYVVYENNVDVGTATATVYGIGRYYGACAAVTFSITQISLEDYAIADIDPQWSYGADDPAVPEVTVSNSEGVTLTEGVDYTVSYSDNVEAGAATVTVSGIEPGVLGTLSTTFTVVRASDSLLGSGTEENPFQIGSKGDFQYASRQMLLNNETYRTAYYLITADINLAATEESPLAADPLGQIYGSTTGTTRVGLGFAGSIDGDGHTVTLGLEGNVSSSAGYNAHAALIGYAGTYGASAADYPTVTIKNLTVDGWVTGYYAAGFVANGSSAHLVFENCINKAAVGRNTGEADAYYAAGFIAQASDFSFTDCRNEGDVTAYRSSYAGYASGFIAYHNSTSLNTLGLTDQSFTDCINTGDISGTARAGGLLASTQEKGDISILRCGNEGDVTGTESPSYAGGLVGYGAASGGDGAVSISMCYNIGDISAENSAGGLVAYAPYGPLEITNSYNTGSVEQTESGTAYAAGGLVGSDNSGTSASGDRIISGYNAGTVTAASGNAGSVLGYAAARSTSYHTTYYLNAYVLDDDLPALGANSTSNTDRRTINDNTTKMSEEEMKAGASTIGRAFRSDDETDPINNGFPVLYWQLGEEATDISMCEIEAIPSQTYSGSAIEPEITVNQGGDTLTENADYRVTYTDNVNAGTATVTVTGIGVFSGTLTTTFVIEPRSLNGATIADIDSQWVTDTAAAAPIDVTDDLGTALVEGVDFVVDYTDNTSRGTATATVTGIGNYTDTITATFEVFETTEGLEGSGTMADPYLIADKYDLQFVAEKVNDGEGAYAYAAYRLTADIDLTPIGEEPNNTSIGVYSSTTDYVPFRGIFDGDGHTVTLAGTGSGLFAALEDALVYSVETAGSLSASTSYAGALAVIAAGTVEIRDFVNSATVTSSTSYPAGLIGRTASDSIVSIKDSENAGNVSGTAGVAGFIAYAVGDISITGCVNSGSVTSTATSNSYTGGFVAYAPSTGAKISIDQSYNAGSVSAARYAGGFVGSYAGSTSVSSGLSVTNSYNVGSVTSTNGSSTYGQAAGILANAGSNSTITLENVYNAGSITAQSTTYAGALIGSQQQTTSSISVLNSYYLEGSLSGIGYTSLASAVEDQSSSVTAEELASAEMPLLLGSAFSQDTANINSGYPILSQQRTTIADCYVAAVRDQAYTGLAVEPSLVVIDPVTLDVLEEGTDFRVVFADNIEVGTATATIVGIGAYTGSTQTSFRIVKADLSTCEIAPIDGQVANGDPIEPALSIVNAAGVELVEGFDYIVSYYDNVEVGTASVIVVGMGNYEGVIEASFEIAAGSIEDAEIDFETFYDSPASGEAIEISLTVTSDGRALAEGVDYELSITTDEGDPVDAVTSDGAYVLTITGIGAFTGSVSLDFNVGTYFTVYVQEGASGEPEAVKTYTKAEFAALVAEDAPAMSAMYYRSSAWNVLSSDNYVTLEALLADAGLADEFTEGSSIEAGIIGDYTTTVSYEDLMAGQSFYPNMAANADAATGEAVSSVAAFALTSASSTATTTLGDAEAANLAAATDDTAPRFMRGMNADEIAADSKPGGNRYVSNCDGVILITPEPVFFTVSYQAGDNEAVVAKTYTFSEFEALATEDADPVSGMYYRGDVWNVTSSNYYVTLEDLFRDAGVASLWTAGATLYYGSSDGSTPNSAQTYEAIAEQCWFFPEAYGSLSEDPDTRDPAPVVLTITEHSSATSSSSSAGDQETYNLQNANTNNQPRIIWGISESDYLDPDNGSVAGNRYWSKVSFVTISLSEAIDMSSATVEGVEASYAYTGEAIEFAPLVSLDGVDLTEGTDYEVAIVNADSEEVEAAVEAGSYELVITGIGLYTGEVRVEFSVVEESSGSPGDDEDPSDPTVSSTDLSGASVSLSDDELTYTGYLIQPAATVVLDGEELTLNVDYVVTYANNIDAGTATATVWGVGSYSGSTSVTFTIDPASLEAVDLSVSPTYYVGEEVEIVITARFNGKQLVAGEDYTLVMSGSYELPGDVLTVTLTGMGNFTETTGGVFTLRSSAAESFPDIEDDPSSYEWFVTNGSLDYVVTQGIMSGYTSGDEAGTFGPYDSLTRGQIATILWRIAGTPTASAEAFSDVDYTQYYGDAISWARSTGIITGYQTDAGESTGLFGPDDLVTREQLATMIARYAAWAGESVSSDGTSLNELLDGASVSDFAREYMGWCLDVGIMTGVEADDGFYADPQSNATRAQAATMVMRLVLNVLDA